MKVAGEYTFDAPIHLVWNALQNPTILASILPGCDKLEQIGENEYVGGLNIKVGPVQGKFSGNIKLENIRPLVGYTMIVDGSGPAGFVKATGNLQLTELGEKTPIAYEGDAQVGGRIASVGQRLIESSAKAIIKQSLEALNNVLKAQVAALPVSTVVAPPAALNDVASASARAEAPTESVAAVPSTPPVAPVLPPLPPLPQAQAPSQLEFATGVAKEVAKDLVPAQYRPLLIALIVVVIVLLFYFFSR